ncbi:hypothetical protein ACPXCX_42370 [Streptomyces sp. DT225]
MSDERHVLVLPDRDGAEEAAEELAERFGVTAEDAQWLLVVEDPDRRLDPAALDAFAAEYEGWLEAP